MTLTSQIQPTYSSFHQTPFLAIAIAATDHSKTEQLETSKCLVFSIPLFSFQAPTVISGVQWGSELWICLDRKKASFEMFCFWNGWHFLGTILYFTIQSFEN